MAVVIPEIKQDLVVQVLLQRNEVGKVIGRKGAVVEGLKAKSGASISISDYSRTLPRIATIRGPVERVVTAVHMIAVAIKAPSAPPQDGAEEKPVESKASAEPESKEGLDVTLIVPQNQVGPIIGKGGVRINSLRQASGASIQITSDKMEGLGNTIHISGNSRQLSDALSRLAQLLHAARQRSNAATFGIQNLNIRGAGPNSPLSSPQGAVAGSSSLGSNVLSMQPMMQAPTQSLFSSTLPFAGGPMGLSSSRSGGRSGKGSNPSVSITAIVPDSKAGVLIGRKGQTIQRIKAQSGAQISVSEFQKGNENRVVTIKSHNVQAIQKALAAMVCTLDGNAPTSSAKLSVPPSSLGSIIGRKGTRVQAIRQSTGAVVQIEKDGIVTINGPRLSVCLAGSMVIERLCQHQLRQPPSESKEQPGPVEAASAPVPVQPQPTQASQPSPPPPQGPPPLAASAAGAGGFLGLPMTRPPARSME
mmetsp:Transcript_36789/g.70929  ORF Transcript_36789/g.70929 Transcript_36789/m.70929 type:complete len:475 (-) Transcript_36789:124-1548(-)